MNIDVARHTVRQSFRIGRELQDALVFLKERCEPEDYKQYAINIATAINAVNTALLKKAIKAYPNLEREIEDQISAYGRYL
jgi:hypothetical protein